MTDQPTPLTDAQPTIAQYEPKPTTYFVAVDFARALEQRMRAAEALLYEAALAWPNPVSYGVYVDVKAHFATAQAMDAGNKENKSHE